MSKTIKYFFIVCFLFVNGYSQTFIVNKNSLSLVNPDNKPAQPTQYYTGNPAEMITYTSYEPDYITIGPEIPVLSGFYDWQTNGTCPRYIYWNSNSIVHAIYMLSTDSTQLSSSRRTYYAFSSNGGSNWSSLGPVPNTRSGFPTLTSGSVGASNQCAIIVNNCQLAPPLNPFIHVDLAPGVGVFTSTGWNSSTTGLSSPFVSTMSNGKILVAAETYQGSAATDTGIVAIFNPNTYTWETSIKIFTSSASTQLNMGWTGAAGPNGKAIYVLDALNDTSGPYGGNRIFYWTSTDNGLTWSNQNVLFNTFVDPTGDTVTAWLGLDAVYDNAGNFYVVYNTIADSFQTAKIWISKNGAPSVIVASNLQIPGSLWGMTEFMAHVISMDWPTVSVSEDNNFVFVGYSVFKQNDIVNNFQSADVYISYAPAGSLSFGAPVQISSGIHDERYMSFNRKAINSSGDHIIHTVYQKDPQPGSSAFNDNAPISRATLVYRQIKNVDPFAVKDPGTKIPKEFALLQNFPNPFNPVTKIKFNISKHSLVELSIFDATGRKIETIVNEQLAPGSYEQEWNAENYSSGLYIVKMTAGDFTDFKKMILIK